MSARKAERRRAWRRELREQARLARAMRRNSAIDRAIAVERERSRRGDAYALSVLVAVETIARVAQGSEVWRECRETICEFRGIRRSLWNLNRLDDRARMLARRPPVVLSGTPVQTVARVQAIVDTSDVAIPTGPRDWAPVTWVWDGDCADTYRRMRELRGAP